MGWPHNIPASRSATHLRLRKLCGEVIRTTGYNLYLTPISNHNFCLIGFKITTSTPIPDWSREGSEFYKSPPSLSYQHQLIALINSSDHTHHEILLRIPHSPRCWRSSVCRCLPGSFDTRDREFASHYSPENNYSVVHVCLSLLELLCPSRASVVTVIPTSAPRVW